MKRVLYRIIQNKQRLTCTMLSTCNIYTYIIYSYIVLSTSIYDDAVYLYLLALNQTLAESNVDYREGHVIVSKTIGQRFAGRHLMRLNDTYACRPQAFTAQQSLSFNLLKWVDQNSKFTVSSLGPYVMRRKHQDWNCCCSCPRKIKLVWNLISNDNANKAVICKLSTYTLSIKNDPWLYKNRSQMQCEHSEGTVNQRGHCYNF